MEAIKVEAVSIGKTQKGNDKTGLKAGGKWFNVMGAHPDLKGKEVKLKPGKFDGWYEIEFIVDEKQAANGVGHDPLQPKATGGPVTWSEYEHMARLAHSLAKALEPDDIAGENIAQDRSTARTAILNTVMIAFSNGKVALPEGDDAGAPF